MPRIDQNLSDVKEEDMNRDGSWSALKPGDYPFMVTETDYKQNGKRNGNTLWIKVQCIDPQHPSAKWTEFLAIDNPSPEAVRIARAKLKQLAIAVGHPNPDFVEYSEDLHSIAFMATVTIEPANEAKYGDRNGMQNRIGAYKPMNGGGVPVPAQRTRSHDEPPPHNDNDIPF